MQTIQKEKIVFSLIILISQAKVLIGGSFIMLMMQMLIPIMMALVTKKNLKHGQALT
jgi:hypothetical protein